MVIHIRDYLSALEFIPTQPIVAIRIFDKNQNSANFRRNSRQLVQSDNYLAIFSFEFNDIDPYELDSYSPEIKRKYFNHLSRPFTSLQARSILSIPFQFINNHPSLDFLIHCHMGQSRSPAVGIALAQTFNLGHSYMDLMMDYPHFNRYVYRTIIHEAYRTGITTKI